MTNKFKRAIAGVMAVAVVAVSSIGMSASAYAPTVSKSFGVGSTYATAELYRDSGQTSARVVLSGASALNVSLYVNGTVSRTTTSGSIASGYVKVVKNGSNFSYAKGSYSATKSGSSGSTTLTC